MGALSMTYRFRESRSKLRQESQFIMEIGFEVKAAVERSHDASRKMEISSVDAPFVYTAPNVGRPRRIIRNSASGW